MNFSLVRQKRVFILCAHVSSISTVVQFQRKKSIRARLSTKLIRFLFHETVGWEASGVRNTATAKALPSESPH